MLRSLILCPNVEVAARLQDALVATGEITVGRILQTYPKAIDLVRTLRAQAPEVLFLSFEDVGRAHEVVKLLETEAPGLPIVAIYDKFDPHVLREFMRAGIREFLVDPFEPDAVVESLSAVRTLIERKPPSIESTSQIFAFIPSKAGVGTSTIALNVSAAMARRNMNVLLSDFDLNSGMMRFLLKLQNDYSVVDAVEHALEIDENLWPQLVTSINTLDVLHAGRCNPSLRVESAQVRALVDFMRRNYQALCFDLSGNLERYSVEIMSDCKRIMMVCTPEIPSLHLAREKIAFLRNFDLDSRVSVVLNRVQKKAMFTKDQVEEILASPVVQIFPNDYVGVNRATTAGTIIDVNSELGKSFAQFAMHLIEQRPVALPGKKRFLEMVQVTNRPLIAAKK
jgi:Flp pilus assembly CpaE family ATPase